MQGIFWPTLPISLGGSVTEALAEVFKGGGCVSERPVLYCASCYCPISFSTEAKEPSAEPAVPAGALDLCRLKSSQKVSGSYVLEGGSHEVKGSVTNRKGVQ